MNWFVSALALGAATLLVGCESVRYVKSELSGTAKPEGGTQEVVSPSRTYNATPQVLRRAVLAVLGEQGYVYEDSSSTGAIKTEPKSLTDTSKFGFAGATYHAKLFITFDGSVVTYRAKFDKKSNITMPELNVEFPEKENELRKDFFAALDKRLTTGSSDQSQGATPPPSTPPQRPTSSVDSGAPTVAKGTSDGKATESMSVAEMQRALLSLGYQVGTPDGVNGKRTIDALKKFQQANKLPVTGQLDPESAARLRASARTKK